MAGLWDASTRDDGSVIEPCAVITVPANAVIVAAEYQTVLPSEERIAKELAETTRRLEARRGA